MSSFLCFALLCGLASAAVESDIRNVVRKRLEVPTKVQDYPCAAGYAWFFTDGALRECAVSRNIVFGEIAIPDKSWINLKHDGKPDFVFLAHDTRIEDYTCKGGGPLGPTEGAMTALYPDGKLRICWLQKDTVIKGVPCSRASMLADAFGGGSATEFHENGQLKSCKLSRDFAAGDRVFRRGDHIHLDAAGRLLPAPPRVQ